MMERAVLLSDPTPEFMDNTPQAFKVRLGEPMTFQDEWEVALAALSTPDTALAWEKKDEILFQTRFTIQQQPTRTKTEVNSQYTLRKLQQQTDITNGVQLLRALFFAIEKTCYQRMQEAQQDVFQGQRISLAFHNVADHGTVVVLEAKPLHDIKNNGMLRMFFKVNANLAVRMGWLNDDHSQLGPNLYPSLPTVDGIIHYRNETELERRALWQVVDGFLHLSLRFNWHFFNLDQALKDGQPSKRMFVYCDLVESNRMGGAIAPLDARSAFCRDGDSVFRAVALPMDAAATRVGGHRGSGIGRPGRYHARLCQGTNHAHRVVSKSDGIKTCVGGGAQHHSS